MDGEELNSASEERESSGSSSAESPEQRRRQGATMPRNASSSSSSPSSSSSSSEGSLRAELERLSRELASSSREKVQAAEYGLAVLEEKQALQERCDAFEQAYEAMRAEMDLLKEALGQMYCSQRQTVAEGATREEFLLDESAGKDAFYLSEFLRLEGEVRHSRTTLSNAQAEAQRLDCLTLGLSESVQELQSERGLLREELKQYKLQEARLLQDFSELEEENISLQKQVSTLKQNQVEYEGLKLKIRQLEQEVEFINSQQEEALRLKSMAEKQLEESLEVLAAEREQKSLLRKEFAHLSGFGDGAIALGVPPADASSPERPELDDDATTANGHVPGARQMKGRCSPGDRRSWDGRAPAPGVVSDLLSELRFTEIQKLQQQLAQVEMENNGLQAHLQECQKALAQTEETLSNQRELLNQVTHFKGDSNGNVENGNRGIYPAAPEHSVGNHGTDGVNGKAARRDCSDGEIASLQEKLLDLESREGNVAEKLSSMQERERKLRDLVKVTRQELNAAQEELVLFSEDLANIYNRVCMHNNEMPERVMLDYYKNGGGEEPSAVEGDADSSHDGPPGPLRPAAIADPPGGPGAVPPSPLSSVRAEPMGVGSLTAVIRSQASRLQGAVERALEVSCQRSAARDEEALSAGKDKGALAQEVLKLKSLLNTKREQIQTLRIVLKANKQTAEGALSNLKSRYENEKCLVMETVVKMRNELKALKEDAITFSSLRNMFTTRCDEYALQLDDMQRQLLAAEDEKRTLNSLLRMAIQQKLALTQRLEDLEMGRPEHGRHAHHPGHTKVRPGPPSSPLPPEHR
uniref:Protein bicaudal D homolog 2-like isoform X1 n=1 Tax=Petromyzon marinus TaxID=7757 RepID=A0AAJ7TWK7_PETMA|nr:protein bicaudal D homolog 2-like isoform X1 [Petromyzon marinus]